MTFPRARSVSIASCWYAAACAVVLIGCVAVSSRAGEEEQQPVLKRIEVIGARGMGEAAKSAGAKITIHVNERPLKQVLDYLSQVSNKNVRCKKPNVERLLVTFELENVTYRTILDFIAKKYGLVVDDSMITENIILIDAPEKVTMVFQNADIRDVINTIAIQAGANVIIDQDIIGQITMRIENVPWRSALKMVCKTRDFVDVDEQDNTIRITTPAKVEKQLEIRMFRLMYVSPEGSKYTPVLQSDFTKQEGTTAVAQQGAGATSLMEVMKNVATAQGKMAVEKRSNTIIVRDTATAVEAMSEIVRKLDVPPKQIHIAVKLVQLTDTDTERLGVDWASGLQFSMTPVGNWATSFPFDVSNGLSRSVLGDLSVMDGTRQVLNPTTGGALAVGDIFSLRKAVATQGASFPSAGIPSIGMGSMGFGSTQALLEMIRQKTRGRVVQAPQLVTLDNEESTIQVGQMVRYAETIVANTEGGGNVGGFREAAGSPLKLGFQLLVIPHVTGPENNILMTLVPKTENFTGFETFGQLKLPQTTQSILVTKLMLRNGETGVIGGLKEENESYAEHKVPIFGDIPFLGRLFKHRSKTLSGNNLLVFVTPTIIDFYETDQFKKDLEKIRQDYSKPFTTIGEEEEASPK